MIRREKFDFKERGAEERVKEAIKWLEENFPKDKRRLDKEIQFFSDKNLGEGYSPDAILLHLLPEGKIGEYFATPQYIGSIGIERLALRVASAAYIVMFLKKGHSTASAASSAGKKCRSIRAKVGG